MGRMYVQIQGGGGQRMVGGWEKEGRWRGGAGDVAKGFKIYVQAFTLAYLTLNVRDYYTLLSQIQLS